MSRTNGLKIVTRDDSTGLLDAMSTGVMTGASIVPRPRNRSLLGFAGGGDHSGNADCLRSGHGMSQRGVYLGRGTGGAPCRQGLEA